MIREVDDAGVRVVQRDVRNVRLEDHADLLSDKIEQRCELELARELLRHRVDGGELGGAPLRFGEQARILDGDGRLQRESNQKIELGGGERHSSRPPHRHHALDGLAGQ